MQPTRLFPIQIFTGLLFSLLVYSNKLNAQGKHDAAIIEVLSSASDAFFKDDIEKWKSYFIQDSLTSRSIIDRFEYQTQIGWPNVVAAITKDSQQMYPGYVKSTYENVHIRLSGNFAYVEADERQKWIQNGSEFNPSPVHTHSVLIFDNQSWKIASRIRISGQTYEPTQTNREYVLNAMGYELLKENRVKEAIDIFVVTVKLNPESWNTYDSLGEAYALAGETKLAIANYEKSVQLNPKNEDGKKKLESLKK
ncbi:hypothetical protein [Dyadobacter sp. CY312]|uniref:hypothetical protein n=1 Tax=Dyadobacter sp. CY312 TaxID=2907303 RepID=UPI001F2CDC46|nr:hypothetical protein [Dyadobacter sp. CY312]MCE7042041.1 hypothetical protein [Dyadobacter sp. CY312]